MKTMKIPFILLLITAALTAPLQLISASTSVDSTSSLTGSTFGGRTIYIKGVGFPSMPDSLTVYIGTYPCIIPADGLTPTTLSCETTSTGSSSAKLNLPIKIIYNYEIYKLSGYTFSYTQTETPIISDVIPSSSVASTQLNFYGIHRVNDQGDNQRDTGDFIGLWVDSDLCDILDIQQDTISYSSTSRVKCNQAKLQQAGRYSVSEHVTVGWATKQWKMQRSSLNGEYFEHTILPAVSSISPNSGALQGQQLTITGSGFSNNKKNVSVSIDGVNCDVISSSTTQVTCNLAAKSTQSALLETNSTSSAGYISGSGFKYKKYSISSLSSKTTDGLKAAVDSNSASITQTSSGVTAQLESVLVSGDVCGQVFKGYFYAPVSGNYIFRGAADDSFALYINQDYGTSVNTTLSKIAYSTSASSYFDNYYIQHQPTALSGEISLEGGKYYYTQLYHVNVGGPGQFKISVEVPNTNEALIKKRFEVNSIQTSTSFDPEIIKFTLDNAVGGTFNISIQRKNSQTLQVLYKQNVKINFDATTSQFANAITSFDIYSGVDLSVTGVERFDENGTLLNSSTGSTKSVWSVRIPRLRASTSISQTFTFNGNNLTSAPSKTPTFTQTNVQSHSPLISGYFSLSIGSTPIMIYDSVSKTYSDDKIPASVSAATLQGAIRVFEGFEKTQVTRINDPSYGATWIISFLQHTGDVPDLILSSSGLTGGSAGSPTVSFVQTRQYSSNVIFNPVDESFLFSESSVSNVLVKVNGLTSVCSSDCSYTFVSNVPQVKAQSLTGSTLSIQIQNPTVQTILSSNLLIQLNNHNCQSVTGTFPTFSCSLPTAVSGQLLLQAGSHNVQVFIEGTGYIGLQSGVNPIEYDLILNSVSPSTGGQNGGYVVSITGTGLPDSIADLSVSLCGLQAQIIEVIDNSKLNFYAPPCSSGSNQISVSIPSTSISKTFPFDYVTASGLPTIASISPQGASPVLKGILTITGTNFGLNISTVHVSLANSTGRVYPMRVLSLNDTVITCGLPGGLQGGYDVKVMIDGIGDATPVTVDVDDFKYELAIESISPSSGSYYGGTLITIIGQYFSADISENLVGVGNELNTLCTIQSVTSTHIKCRTPSTHPDWTSNIQQLTVTNRLIQDSICLTNLCSFQYLPIQQASTLSSLSSSSLTPSANTNLTLSGTNLKLSSSPQVVFYNTITKISTIVSVISATNQTIVVGVPLVEAGNYIVKVRNQPNGESNGLSLVLNSAWSAASVNRSTKGGYLSILGSGLPNGWPSPYFSLKIVSQGVTLTPEVISSTPSNLTIKLASGINSQVSTLTLTTPSQSSISYKITQNSASTPTLTISSPLSASASGLISVQLNRTSLSSSNPIIISVYNVLNPQVTQDIVGWTYNGTVINFQHAFKAGKYAFNVFYSSYGWGDVSGYVEVLAATTYTAVSVQTSVLGGEITVNGDDISPQAIIRIGGFKGEVISQTSTASTFRIPALITTQTLQQYSFLSESSTLLPSTSVVSDTNTNSAYSFDKTTSTYYSSSSSECYIGVDVGEGRTAKVDRIKYFPNFNWAIAANYLNGAVFQGSLDNSNYVQIAKVDQTVHSGWNSIQVTLSSTFRYLRFKHNTTSKCQIAEIQFYGILHNDITVSDPQNHTADVIFDDGKNTFTFAGAVQYRRDSTPVVQSVSPKTGSVFGGDSLTLTGLNLDIGTPTVSIDGVECVVNGASSSATQIVCVTGARSSLPAVNSFVVLVNGRIAAVEQQFLYVQRWSDIRTWGTDLPPVQGDVVYVPQGMTLFVDQTTPRLDGIIVSGGKIIFADESDIEVHTNLITVNGGEFRAGTENHPYQNKLTFILYGSYYGVQLPMYGNKGIICHNCKFSLFGTPKIKTWTQLSSTINPNDDTLTVIDGITDWQVGDEIVVASTDFDHNQAEQRRITAISGNTITVDRPFVYKHSGVVQTYGTATLPMRAEVGLLTRNIKVMGDPTSEQGQYGSHLMMAGNGDEGLVGHIAYTEFTHCGQPRIVGRYCIHFHMAGDVQDSFVKGNAVHHSFARILTIHGIRFLVASDNVGYRVKGHNFFIEDGIQTHNTIENNLVIGSLETFNMMQTDISVASFWITNPSNNVRNNRAAGGDFYGFWYEIKDHPDGPSATEDVCPIGNPLGESHDNIAHSYKRFGLRIFKLYSRKIPCASIRESSLEDPWSANPSIQSRFYNYITYKIGEAGLLAEQVGNMIFENFTIAENGRAGMEFYRTNFTKELVEAKDSTIIGETNTNPSAGPSPIIGSSGLIAPRTSGVKISGVNFYNFPASTTVFETCSHCDEEKLYTNTGCEYILENINVNNVSGNYLKWTGVKRDIIYDIDGSFSNSFSASTGSSGTIVYNYPHLRQDSDCEQSTDAKWGSSLLCNQNAVIRKVMITNLENTDYFDKSPMKVQLLSDVNEVVDANSTSFTQIFSLLGNKMQPMLDKKKAYALPFIAGRVYNVWWLTGIDFTHMSIDISKMFQTADPAILFKFNYTERREFFEIGNLVNKEIQGNFTTVSPNPLDSSSCEIGDFNHDPDLRTLTLCLSNRGQSRKFQYLDVNGIRCRYLCPSDTNQYVKQNFIRYWSIPAHWPEGVIPTAGQNVTINGTWTMIMDVVPATINHLQVEGDLIISEDLSDVRIIANSIWIRSGSIKAGNSSIPFPGKLTFEIRGQRQDAGLVIDPLIAGSKLFVVNGKLELYGQAPSTKWTKLTSIARPNTTYITVSSSNGWKIGDQLVISPSFTTASQHEKVTITGINGTTITFTPALAYLHYGASSATITNSIGTLDTRAGVGHLSRNIKIVSGNDAGWGFHLLAYGFIDGEILRSGSMILQGVEIYEGGQYDSQKSAVKIYNTVSNKTIKITGSSIHNCKAYCLDILNINNAQITNNVFYQGRLFIVRANDVDNYNFANNLLISATKRPTQPNKQELIACYAMYNALHEKTVSINNNLCQGSDLHGFILPYVPCDYLGSIPYANNTAGSAQIGWVFNKVDGSCMAMSGVRAYGCNIAQIASSPNTAQLILENFMIADSNRGVTLRFGRQADDNTAYFRNSYVTAISRPTCSECYGGTANKCTGARGVRMLAVTINGESLPSSFGTDFDVICKQQSFDSKAFIDNVIFQNFNQQYGSLPQCSNNVVFEPHNLASDMTGSHHLSNTVCNNCSPTAFARFTTPDPGDLGWFGGCGSILCTGKNNYIIMDHTGDFLGQPGFLLANNSQIGDKTTNCTRIPQINGHICKRTDYGVIEYESIAPDFNTRIMWPVYLKYHGGAWNTSTNGWREWEWQGNQPLNKRLGRFVSVVQLYQSYNMTFESEPPHDMRLQFQRRTVNGDNSEFIIIRLHYPRPNSIRVQNRGTVMKPISLLDNNGQLPLNTSLCGSNKFFYQNYTIHFVLTGEKSCQPRVSLTNSIQLTARFNMDINDFFSQDGETKFIDRMCAVLKITDTSRLKIVGIYNGSVTINAFIDEPLTTTVDNATANNNTVNAQQMANLNALLVQLYQSGELNTQFSDLGPLLTMSSSIFYLQDKEEQVLITSFNRDVTALAVGLSLGLAFVVLMGVGIFVYLKRRKAQIHIMDQKTEVKIHHIDPSETEEVEVDDE